MCKFEFSSVLVFSQDSVNNHQYTRDTVFVKDVQNLNQFGRITFCFNFAIIIVMRAQNQEGKTCKHFARSFTKSSEIGFKAKGCQLITVTLEIENKSFADGSESRVRIWRKEDLW